VDPGRLGPHPTAAPGSVPELTATQKVALEKLNACARRNEVCLDIQKGDLVFINNWGLLHRRDQFRDGVATSRHLMRSWLRNSTFGWSVPEAMSIPWRAAYENYPRLFQKLYAVVPQPVLEIPKYSAGSAAFMIEEDN
jgi:hypothetical protein